MLGQNTDFFHKRAFFALIMGISEDVDGNAKIALVTPFICGFGSCVIQIMLMFEQSQEL